MGPPADFPKTTTTRWISKVALTLITGQFLLETGVPRGFFLKLVLCNTVSLFENRAMEPTSFKERNSWA